LPVGYKRIAKMPRWAERYCREHDGETVPMEMLGVLLRADVPEGV